ncbi:hypothetical protein Tco_1157197 [Tanacetum coccineum]
MHNHLSYHGKRVTKSPHIHYGLKPKVPLDIHPTSRNSKMFDLTYGLRNYHMRPGTSTRCYFSVMEGFLHHLWKISNHRLEDDLRVKFGKIRKRKANEENDIQSFTRKARLVAVMIARSSSSVKNDEIGPSSEE